MPETVVSLGIAGLAAILMCAGSAKGAVPSPAAEGLTELLRRSRPVPVWFVRVFAVTEIAAAALLMWPTTRPAGLVVIALFGLVFGGLGVVGVVRGGREPCGCFGRVTGRPIGWPNVALGGLMLATALALLGLRASTEPATAPLLLATTAVLVLAGAMWLYRDLLIAVARSQGLIRS